MASPLSKPALFITGTDTAVGKTLVTCAIARVLQQRGVRVGLCKPIATGCTMHEHQWISDDARALERHCDLPLDLATIQPIGFELPLAPAVAAEQSGKPVKRATIAAALGRIQSQTQVLLIEGVGGISVPLSGRSTVLDLASWLDAPVLVVSRAGLGTLNHTALTCNAIRDRGLRLAGLIVNSQNVDPLDESVASNPHWLARQNRTQVLATLPQARSVALHRRDVPQVFIDALSATNWKAICRKPR